MLGPPWRGSAVLTSLIDLIFILSLCLCFHVISAEYFSRSREKTRKKETENSDNSVGISNSLFQAKNARHAADAWMHSSKGKEEKKKRQEKLFLGEKGFVRHD